MDVESRTSIRSAGLAVLALWLNACGGSAPPEAPLSFVDTPLEIVDTASGQLKVALRSSPQPPVKGENGVQVVVTDQTGAPVDGLALTMVPWMPAHGHGTSVQPVITPGDQVGVFVANPIFLYMTGQWELRIALDGGDRHDTATATVDIP
jgi:hypothetical protein